MRNRERKGGVGRHEGGTERGREGAGREGRRRVGWGGLTER